LRTSFPRSSPSSQPSIRPADSLAKEQRPFGSKHRKPSSVGSGRARGRWWVRRVRPVVALSESVTLIALLSVRPPDPSRLPGFQPGGPADCGVNPRRSNRRAVGHVYGKRPASIPSHDNACLSTKCANIMRPVAARSPPVWGLQARACERRGRSEGGARQHSRRRCGGRLHGDVGTDEDLRRRGLPLGVLIPLQEPNRQVVRHGDVRQQAQDQEVPPEEAR
jgi:hypothetical protein